MKTGSLLVVAFLISISSIKAQNYKLLESTPSHVKIEFDFNNVYRIIDTVINGDTFQIIRGNGYPLYSAGDPWLPAYFIDLGIPSNAVPEIKILTLNKTTYLNKRILPLPVNDTTTSPITTKSYNEKIYGANSFFPSSPAKVIDDFSYRYSHVIVLNASPFQYNPVTRQLNYNKKIVVEVDFVNSISKSAVLSRINDPETNKFIKNNLVNKNEAVNWTDKEVSTKTISGIESYWYNPSKNYYKIYIHNKGIYRLTFDQLIAAGVPLNKVPIDKLELINNGEDVPIYISDANHNNIFDSGDYIEFVGYPPTPTPYCRLNIYNNDNVYFLSYQADSAGLRYNVTDGYPNTWDKTYQTNYTTLHFEKDSIYENLGYAGNADRDFWMWDEASGQNRSIIHSFTGVFNSMPHWDLDSNRVKISVQLQGLTTNGSSCTYDHKAYIAITSQPIGSISWSGQNTATFNKTFYVSSDSIKIYPTGNQLQISVNGDACPVVNSDQIAVDWFDISYWRYNIADTNHINFTSPPNIKGKIRYWMLQWLSDSILVFIPQKNAVIKNSFVTHDAYNSVFFDDSVKSPTDYFCAGYDYFMNVDSIEKSESSDLRNTSNGADYIIITHPKFKEAAEKLAAFRSSHFPDPQISNPRVKIVYVNQIYNEFSNGLLDPNALQEFVQYAFNNWQKPAPSYVVLIGGMSHDYRQLLSTSFQNYIPSIPYYTDTYGEGQSDNLIVCVSGNDIHPDLAIGRISCQTLDEANAQVDKIINYPDDATKSWRQNVLLVSAGLSLSDENYLGLNDASAQLGYSFLDPHGLKTTKIMAFPNKPEYEQFQGGGPAIRDAINKGASLVNYYGHGGGYQWDLIFLNDDINLLENGGRLPLVLSLTCYTAHFDDMDVFGEQFNEAVGKGSIGFFGNFGLTYWTVAKYVDDLIFDQIFNQDNKITGSVFQTAKDIMPSSGVYASQIAYLTYLGDPALSLAIPDKPDFAVNSSDISIQKGNTLVNDTLQIKVNIQNYGTNFPGDTVSVQLFINSQDTSYQLGLKKLANFVLKDSTYFTWIPKKPGTYNITAKVNEVNILPEMDQSDNSATLSITIYNLNNPNIIAPIDGLRSTKNNIEFKIADISDYLPFPVKYYIQIDTSLSFLRPIGSPQLAGVDGLVKWISPSLSGGQYFWRARILNSSDSSNWSSPRSFSISSKTYEGYYASGKQLKLYKSSNMNLTDSGFVLNTSLQPPRPSVNTFIEDINFYTAVLDSVGISALATDGTYLYFGDIWYYALTNNTSGSTKIYKVGTGFNGTVKGQFYGAIPKFFAPINNSLFYFRDGYLYAATRNPHFLLRINKATGDTNSVYLPEGLLNGANGKVDAGSYYVTSDSNYVYNLTYKDSLGNQVYILRTFNPANNWSLVRPDYKLTGTSYTGFSGFFVADGYIFPYENYESGFMRRIRISDGFFEEEWITFIPFEGYYAWCYDWVNNLVYASAFRSGYASKISKFKGSYVSTSGNVITSIIGPASLWKSISYNNDISSSNEKLKTILMGNANGGDIWDTLNVNTPPYLTLTNVNVKKYQYLRLSFNFVDTVFNAANPIKLKYVAADYNSLPEITLDKNELEINPDTILQGLPVNINLKVHNYGLLNDDSVHVKLYLNNSDSSFFSKYINLSIDSLKQITTVISTNILQHKNIINASAVSPINEFYQFNNTSQKDFYVAVDSTKPSLTVTFDGKVIANGDIISAKPKVFIQLRDNSPFPLDTSDFSIVFDNNILNYNRPDIQYSYSPYPNSAATIIWQPALKDGKHTLDILAKDVTGNYADSSAAHYEFYVYNNAGIMNVYNYPDPFKTDTYFTFQLTGIQVPDELKIRLYTIAGRLIKVISIPPSELQIGFNHIHWDGRDEDGDIIANGVYLYKIIYKSGDVIKSVIQKLAKVE